MMNEVVLYQPEIPPNTGNIIRLCANTQSKLSLIRPLGFELDNKHMRRAGLDYHDQSIVNVFDSFESWFSQKQCPFYTLSTHGKKYYHQQSYSHENIIMFGPETRGLPDHIRFHQMATCIKIPMAKAQRSLNLSNSVAICLYEVLRQQSFNFV